MLPTMHPDHHHTTAASGHDHGSGMMMMVSSTVSMKWSVFPCLWFRVTCHLEDCGLQNWKLSLALEGMNQPS